MINQLIKLNNYDEIVDEHSSSTLSLNELKKLIYTHYEQNYTEKKQYERAMRLFLVFMLLVSLASTLILVFLVDSWLIRKLFIIFLPLGFGGIFYAINERFGGNKLDADTDYKSILEDLRIKGYKVDIAI